MKPLSLQGHTRALTRVRINNDGDLLFTASKDKSPCVWFMENGELVGTYQGHTGAIADIDVSWNTKMLASASADQSVKVCFTYSLFIVRFGMLRLERRLAIALLIHRVIQFRLLTADICLLTRPQKLAINRRCSLLLICVTRIS
jgi:hypothetical protein